MVSVSESVSQLVRERVPGEKKGSEVIKYPRKKGLLV
jgi:hypothetical protein